jgi:hypothetical protein
VVKSGPPLWEAGNNSPEVKQGHERDYFAYVCRNMLINASELRNVFYGEMAWSVPLFPTIKRLWDILKDRLSI